MLIVTEAFNGAVCGLSAFLPAGRSEACLFESFNASLDESLDAPSAFATGFAVLPVASLDNALTLALGSSLTIFLALDLSTAVLVASSLATAFITLGALTSFATSFFAGIFTAVLVTTFVVAGLVLLAEITALVTATLGTDFAGAVLATTFFAAEDIGVFAGFFIALAIESNLPEQRWQSSSYKKTMIIRQIN
ncbi:MULTISPECIES: hypothetical protein [unclassified Undibacterium]|uniref:hypothetical protein n=1 Tax=unclassified Undibacterium TaxID=2630295 RepID=UPI003399F619